MLVFIHIILFTSQSERNFYSDDKKVGYSFSIPSVLNVDTQNMLTTETTSPETTTREVESSKKIESSSKNNTVNKKPKATTETTTSKPAVETTKSDTIYYSNNDIIDLAKILYAECRGVESKTQKACVVWCVLNRVDSSGSTIHSILRAPNQYAFRESSPVKDDLMSLAEDVLSRWNLEKNGKSNVGRVLPNNYMYFYGDGQKNYFRDAYNGNYNIWDYSLESPYSN